MINIIAAMDEKRGIGKNNDLLFKISDDFKRMKELTLGHPVVMGRKTFESLGLKLEGRTHVVITSDPLNIQGLDYQSDITASSLEEGIKQAQNSPGSDEIFIFGGGRVFAEALENGLVEKLYLTIVDGDYGADVFFPDYSEFGNIVSEESGKSDGYKYKFLDIEK